MICIWCLVFSPNYCGIVCAARDRDQADELRKAIETIQPATGDHMTIYLDDLEGFEIVDA